MLRKSGHPTAAINKIPTKTMERESYTYVYIGTVFCGALW